MVVEFVKVLCIIRGCNMVDGYAVAAKRHKLRCSSKECLV